MTLGARPEHATRILASFMSISASIKSFVKQQRMKVLINSGATAEGIGQVYELAKRRGFTTIGIVSSLARDALENPSRTFLPT